MCLPREAVLFLLILCLLKKSIRYNTRAKRYGSVCIILLRYSTIKSKFKRIIIYLFSDEHCDDEIVYNFTLLLLLFFFFVRKTNICIDNQILVFFFFFVLYIIAFPTCTEKIKIFALLY